MEGWHNKWCQTFIANPKIKVCCCVLRRLSPWTQAPSAQFASVLHRMAMQERLPLSFLPSTRASAVRGQPFMQYRKIHGCVLIFSTHSNTRPLSPLPGNALAARWQSAEARQPHAVQPQRRDGDALHHRQAVQGPAGRAHVDAERHRPTLHQVSLTRVSPIVFHVLRAAMRATLVKSRLGIPALTLTLTLTLVGQGASKASPGREAAASHILL